MKILKQSVLVIFFILLSAIAGFSQPVREINCFRNFQETNDGDSKINTYLLGYVTYLMYPERLARELTGVIYTDNDPRNTDDDLFATQFKNKFEPMFWNPNLVTKTDVVAKSELLVTSLTAAPNTRPYIKFLTNHTRSKIGMDPEAMIISTPKFIIIAFRGTDRVLSSDQFTHDAGEWVGTDFKAPLITDINITGRVHQGIWESVSLLRSTLDNEIKQNDPGHTKQIWITGHSLGAGQAELYTDYIIEQNVVPKSRVHCYMYAGPSFIGDQDFANKIEALGSKVQRFEYQMDMVTMISPGLANAFSPAIAAALKDGCTFGCVYQKSGQRNWFSSPTSYNYNFRERNILLGDLVTANTPCEHNPNWYVRAAYNRLSAAEQTTVPAEAPFTNLAGCNADGTTKTILPPANTFTPGQYFIKCVTGGKYLDIPGSCIDNDCLFSQGCQAQLWSLETGQHNRKFNIQIVGGAILNGYTIQSTANNKVLDANTNPFKGKTTGENGCIVQICDRLLTGIRTNQEWYLEKIADTDHYIIRCIKDGRVLDAKDDCVNNNGCAVILNGRGTNDHTQEWILEPVH